MTSPSAPESPAGQTLIPRSLQTYAVFYGGLLVVAGVLGFKLIRLPLPGLETLAVPGGVFGFLLAIVTVNATAELHGRPVAQRMVFMGFVPLIVSLGLMQLVLALPPAQGWEGQATAQAVFGSSIRLMLAGMVAYGVSQTLDVTIFTWMRGRPGGHMLWLRASVAALVAQTVDTLIFVTIAFLGVFPLLPVIGGQLVAKAFVWFLAIPLLYLVVWAGRRLDRR
ncbi:queuosine precursor transporter [Sandaracinobacter sp. RS1-74]|uniref:queuosine precursor transporter n=1 Tax=Sandaracinobacteroides sayramensis TaxID=2913411 RepID=UPI001EDC09CA|nr:queuosine precursor transporter [Sandaracinobacteroides sayramensis]MCG2840733.1 queuosine precursor transporter [Sandaracinobacteroides sayramensis]